MSEQEPLPTPDASPGSDPFLAPAPSFAAGDSPDSSKALVEFRLKAGPIVAQARGLTPAARMRLADLARQLGIPEDQVEPAIRSLTSPVAAAARSKSADKFRRRLLKDLEPKRGAILGPTHEASILAAAREKYELDDATALEMLASATAELGIQRVRGDAATRNLTDAIQDAIGDHTWIAEDVRRRLYSAGQQWGLGEEAIHAYIEEQLAANRAVAARSVKLSRAIYATVGLLGVFVVVASVVLVMRKEEPPVPSPDTTAESSSAGKRNESAGPPKWWNVDLALAIDRARKELDGFTDVAAELSSADESRRAAGYARLVGLVERVPPDPEDLAIAGAILENAYAHDPSDAAAQAIRDSLVSHLPMSESPLPKHTAAYNLAYWAAETAVSAATQPELSAERRTQLTDELARRTGTRIDPASTLDERTRAVLAGLSRSALRHLAAHAEKSPASVAALQAAVNEQAAMHLDRAELQRLQSQLLLAALSAAEDDQAANPTVRSTDRSTVAESFRPLVVELAASSDPQVTIALVDLYERMQPSPLRDELQSLLLLRLNVSNAPQNPRAIARALRRALGVAPTGSQAVEQRWELLRSRAAEALDRDPAAADMAVRQLTDAAEFAWLATQALALAQGEAGVPIYDELVALYPEEPFVLKVDADDTPLPTPLTSAAGLSPAEQQAFTRFLGLLVHAEANQIQRESALRGLVQLAPKLDDLRLVQARQLAGYLLQNKPDGEQAEAVAAAGVLRRWKQLRLAAADLLGSSNAPAEQQAAMVAALVAHPITDSDAGLWRRALLESVIRDLPATSAAGALPADQRQALDAAAESLSESYRIRARLLGVSPAEYQAAAAPSPILQSCVRRMIAAVSAGSPARQSPAATADFTGWPIELVDRWQKELTVVDYLATDDIARTVLLDELTLKLSVASLLAERPDQSQATLQLLQDSRQRQHEAKTSLVQLRQIEADLLRIWLLLAPGEN